MPFTETYNDPAPVSVHQFLDTICGNACFYSSAVNQINAALRNGSYSIMTVKVDTTTKRDVLAIEFLLNDRQPEYKKALEALSNALRDTYAKVGWDMYAIRKKRDKSGNTVPPIKRTSLPLEQRNNLPGDSDLIPWVVWLAPHGVKMEYV